MNNKIKDYIEDLKHLENVFMTVVYDNYNNKTLSPKDINLLQKVHFECTTSTEYRNLACANCIYKLIFFVGKMYLAYIEQNKDEVKPYQPKLSKVSKPKTNKNGK